MHPKVCSSGPRSLFAIGAISWLPEHIVPDPQKPPASCKPQILPPAARGLAALHNSKASQSSLSGVNVQPISLDYDLKIKADDLYQFVLILRKALKGEISESILDDMFMHEIEDFPNAAIDKIIKSLIHCEKVEVFGNVDGREGSLFELSRQGNVQKLKVQPLFELAHAYKIALKKFCEKSSEYTYDPKFVSASVHRDNELKDCVKIFSENGKFNAAFETYQKINSIGMKNEALDLMLKQSELKKMQAQWVPDPLLQNQTEEHDSKRQKIDNNNQEGLDSLV